MISRSIKDQCYLALPTTSFFITLIESLFLCLFFFFAFFLSHLRKCGQTTLSGAGVGRRISVNQEWNLQLEQPWANTQVPSQVYVPKVVLLP